MRDLPEGHSVQIVKKSTQKSMFDIYAKPIINEKDPTQSVIKLEWNTVEYGGEGKPASSSAYANMNLETGAKIAKDILDGHPFAAKLPVLREVEKDLGTLLNKLKGKADKDAIRMIIESSLSDAITKAHLYPNRIRETWDLKYDKNGNPYYQVVVPGGGKGKTMTESRYISIEAREYKGKLQYHVTTAITQGQKGPNGAVTPVKDAPVKRAKTIVTTSEMCEAMEKLLLFIQGSTNYDIAKGLYRPFTVNTYHANQTLTPNRNQNHNNQYRNQRNNNQGQHYAS